jgi:hypothetical protein
MAVVYLFHQLFQADGDQQANDNGRQVNKEVLPSVDSCVGCVYVEHGKLLLLRGMARLR